MGVSAGYGKGAKGPFLDSLYFSAVGNLSDRTSFQFTIDPLYTGSHIRQPLESFGARSRKSMALKSYSIDQQIYGHWSIRFANLDGTLTPLLRSPFAMSDTFSDEPFSQTSASLRFADGITEVALILGNGEGERINFDPELFYGVNWVYRSSVGFILTSGWSLDGNNLSSEEATRHGAGYLPRKKGFRTERFYAATGLDGSWSKALGLKANVIYQKTTLKDEDKSFVAFPSIPLEGSDWREIVIEDQNGKIANEMKRERLSLSMSYLILARFELGLGLQRIHLQSHIPFGTRAEKDYEATISHWGLSASVQERLRFSLEQYHWRSTRHEEVFSGIPGNAPNFFLLRVTAALL